MSAQGDESDSDDEHPTTSSVHVGTRSPDFQDWDRTHLYFHDFADRLAHMVAHDDDDRLSANFSCLGHVWYLWLHHYGDMLEISFRNVSGGDITFEIGLSIKDANDDKVEDYYHTYSLREGVGEDVMNFITFQKALNNLVNNVLVMEVRMRRPKFPQFPFIPKNPSACKNIQKLHLDEESADVVFEVGGHQEDAKEDNTIKKRKTEVTKFHAHSLILKNAAPLLAELCSLYDPPRTIPIPIVSPETFRHLLLYIYGHDIPEFGADISHTKEIIEAAYRYGVTNLKIEAETYYVSSIAINIENVMDHLHFAHSKNCALLKERVIEFIVTNRVAVLSKK